MAKSSKKISKNEAKSIVLRSKAGKLTHNLMYISFAAWILVLLFGIGLDIILDDTTADLVVPIVNIIEIILFALACYLDGRFDGLTAAAQKE